MTATTIRIPEVSNRYATALFELALAKKILTKVTKDLKALQDLLTKNSDLKQLAESPAISRKEQGNVMQAIAKKAQFLDITQKFIGVVCANRRLSLLVSIIEGFKAKLAAHHSEITGDVVSAVPLTGAQEKAIVTALNKTCHAKVKIQTSVNPAILGGLVIKIGSYLIDNSLQTKLLRLEYAMKGRR